MQVCSIKNCMSAGLYRARKHVFCEKHKDWAVKITKSDHMRRSARYEAGRDEAMSRLAHNNAMQGTQGAVTRKRSF